MKRLIVGICLLTLMAGATIYFLLLRREAGENQTTSNVTVKKEEAFPPNKMVAAPGRVEPVSEEIELSANVSGRLEKVLVEEGSQVYQGQLIAEVEGSNYRAQIALAKSQVLEAEAELRRIINGSQKQERLESAATIEEAKATLKGAELDLNRRRDLYETGDISLEELNHAEKEYQTARARLAALDQRHSLINADAREEDRARARAKIAGMRAQIQDAEANLNKTFIKSPITGVVLRKHAQTGESVSETTQTPIVTLADTSQLRVRVDVDEKDVSKIKVGQKVYVTADAYPNQKFWGKVVRLGLQLGKKNIKTDEPTERLDTKVLETFVDLDADTKLPSGLRVSAFIMLDETN